MPISGQVESLADGAGAKERGAQPTGAQPQGVRGQEQVLGRQSDTLHSHDPFIPLSCRVGVTVHVSHAQADEDEQGGLGNALVRAAYVSGNDFRRDTISLEVSL